MESDFAEQLEDARTRGGFSTRWRIAFRALGTTFVSGLRERGESR